MVWRLPLAMRLLPLMQLLVLPPLLWRRLRLLLPTRLLPIVLAALPLLLLLQRLLPRLPTVPFIAAEVLLAVPAMWLRLLLSPVQVRLLLVPRHILLLLTVVRPTC